MSQIQLKLTKHWTHWMIYSASFEGTASDKISRTLKITGFVQYMIWSCIYSAHEQNEVYIWTLCNSVDIQWERTEIKASWKDPSRRQLCARSFRNQWQSYQRLSLVFVKQWKWKISNGICEEICRMFQNLYILSSHRFEEIRWALKENEAILSLCI